MRTRTFGMLLLIWIVRGIAAVGLTLVGRAILLGIDLGVWEVGWIVFGVVLLMPFFFTRARLSKS